MKIFPKKNSAFVNSRGFILPFTMLVTVLVLFIATGAMTLLSKQLYFSKMYRLTQTAYYAADDAVSCALAIDDTYIGPDGLGIFPSSTTTDATAYIDDVLTYVNTRRLSLNPSLSAITLTDIKCAQSFIFDTNPNTSDFEVSDTFYTYYSPNGPEEGRTSVFKMKMDLGNDERRCAKVTVNKTPSFRQIIGQGYSTCGDITSAVERAVVNTTISE